MVILASALTTPTALSIIGKGLMIGGGFIGPGNRHWFNRR